jgi:hypothetical protein
MVLSSCQFAGSILVAVAVSMTASEALAQGIPDDFVIKLERTSCFGECPVYSVSIDAKGNVTYEGTKFVRVEGRQTDRIPASRVAALLETADRIRFFELNDRYRTIRNPDGTETMVTDLPTTFVTVTRDGRTKRVEDYIGAPKPLQELEQQIDDTARTNAGFDWTSQRFGNWSGKAGLHRPRSAPNCSGRRFKPTMWTW